MALKDLSPFTVFFNNVIIHKSFLKKLKRQSWESKEQDKKKEYEGVILLQKKDESQMETFAKWRRKE